MKPPRKYASAAAFRVALEERLKRLAQEESLDLRRVRRQAAFDRLLCRLFANPNAPWLLKGGYAMELRLKTARTTRDIDLALRRLPVPSADWDANAVGVLESLREAGKLDLQDFFTSFSAMRYRIWTPHLTAARVFRLMRDWLDARS